MEKQDSALRLGDHEHIEQFFTQESIANIRDDIHDVFRVASGIDDTLENTLFQLFNEDFDRFASCCKAAQWLPSLNAIGCSDLTIKCLKHLGLKKPVINTRALLAFSHPDIAKSVMNWKVPAHQDWPSMIGSVNAITMWVPFVDVTNEMGALEFAKNQPCEVVKWTMRENAGSGIKAPMLDGYDDAEFEQIATPAGDALFFNALCVHRSGHNSTNKIRLSAQFRYDDLADKSLIERYYPRPFREVRNDTIREQLQLSSSASDS